MSWLELYQSRFPAESKTLMPVPRCNYLEQIAATKLLKTEPFFNPNSTNDLIKLLLHHNKIDLAEAFLSGKIGNKKTTKWLTDSHVPEAMVSQAASGVSTCADVEFTIDFEDILLMSDSPHYDSCLSRERKGQIVHYLRNPGMGMLVIRGKNGFTFRMIARVGLIRHHMIECLFLNESKIYGKGPPIDKIGKALGGLGIPAFATSGNHKSIEIFEMYKTDIPGNVCYINEDGYIAENPHKKEYDSRFIFYCRAINDLATSYAENMKLVAAAAR